MRTIAVDATGSDHGPLEVIKAAAEVSLHEELACRVVGDLARLRSLLARVIHNPARLELADTSTVFDSTRLIPRERPPSGLDVAAELVRNGEADAAVSAGDTGECVRTWTRAFPLVPGATRPALAGFFPRRADSYLGPRVGLILDVGATLRCRPHDYVSFAALGSAYYEILFGHQPRVGLLNVGTESHKGGEPLVRSRALLGNLGETIDFIGNVEGTNLFDGGVDVVLCDGFTGNVLLKTIEGLADSTLSLLQEAVARHWTWPLAILLFSRGLRALRQATDYAEYGGSPLLGCSAPFIKAHGRSGARALRNAIRAAARAADLGLAARIAEKLAAIQVPGRKPRPTATPRAGL